jgi:steroid delta-isomerase-like uncharacterized protein
MSDQNKQIARRFTEAFASGNLAVFEEIVADDLIDHNARPGQRQGRQAVIDAVALYHAAFPNLQIRIDRDLAEGDLVAQYGTISGTNSGPLMGAPATGKRALFPYIDIHRIVDGRIVESWHLEDIAGMLAQVGRTSG